MLSPAVGFPCLAILTMVVAVKGSDDNRNVTPIVMTVIFVTPRSDLMQHDMAGEVVLNVTVGRGIPMQVTLFKRPQRGQVYVFTSNPSRPHVHVTPEAEEEEVTWYTTGSDKNPQIAVSFHRSPFNGSPFTDIYMSDNGLLVLNEQAYTLTIPYTSTGLEDTSELFKQTYHMIPMGTAMPSARKHRRDVDQSSTGLSDCFNISLEICAHVDFDLFLMFNESVAATRKYVTDVVNKAQLMYEKLPRSNSFPYIIDLELVKIFIEKHFDTDPIKLRETPLTQLVVDGDSLIVFGVGCEGMAYTDIVKAHDLLTAWLTANEQPNCDHYMLLSGTDSSHFKKEGTDWSAYTSMRLGLAWTGGICQYRGGKHTSVILKAHDQRSFLVASHELGHSLGLEHTQDYDLCADSPVNSVMDSTLRNSVSLENVHWTSCSIHALKGILDQSPRSSRSCTWFKQSTLDLACSNKFGAKFTLMPLMMATPHICRMGIRCKSTVTDYRRLMDAPAGSACGAGKMCDQNKNCAKRKGRNQC